MAAETMTLGEALTVRADLQRRLGELRTRLLAPAQVQEGEQPPEQPEATSLRCVGGSTTSTERRELDVALQKANWRTSLAG